MKIKSLLPLFLILCGHLANAADVESVRAYRAPDHTRLVFDISDSVQHKVFTLENPDRIVVDISDSRLRGDLSSLDLRDTPIAGVRSAPRDQSDIRVVFDLKTKVRPRSFVLKENQQYGERLVIDLHDLDAPPSQQTVATEPPSTRQLDSGRRDIVVAISAGHGGDDPGAIGVNRVTEKQVVLAISKEISRILEQTPGFKPVMIRTGDYYVGLRQQIEIAHRHQADLFIAIHADAYSTPAARGATIYALSSNGATSEQARRLAEKENAADLIGGVGSVSLTDKDQVLASVLLDLSMTASISSSLEVGNKVIESMAKVTHMRRRNVEQAAFVVLKSADIPSLLIETGYVTNPTDAKNLASPDHQRKLAQSIVEGITRYFHDKPPRGSWVYWAKQNNGLTSKYTVARGDNLSTIANRHGITLAQLKSANGLSSNTIHVGQVLTLPSRNSPPLAAPAPLTFVEHKIARGETLSGIAQNYRVPMQKIRETNQLLSDNIRVGQILKIPSS